jgi:hypothetical protein
MSKITRRVAGVGLAGLLAANVVVNTLFAEGDTIVPLVVVNYVDEPSYFEVGALNVAGVLESDLQLGIWNYTNRVDGSVHDTSLQIGGCNCSESYSTYTSQAMLIQIGGYNDSGKGGDYFEDRLIQIGGYNHIFSKSSSSCYTQIGIINHHPDKTRIIFSSGGECPKVHEKFFDKEE